MLRIVGRDNRDMEKQRMVQNSISDAVRIQELLAQLERVREGKLMVVDDRWASDISMNICVV